MAANNNNVNNVAAAASEVEDLSQAMVVYVPPTEPSELVENSVGEETVVATEVSNSSFGSQFTSAENSEAVASIIKRVMSALGAVGVNAEVADSVGVDGGVTSAVDVEFGDFGGDAVGDDADVSAPAVDEVDVHVEETEQENGHAVTADDVQVEGNGQESTHVVDDAVLEIEKAREIAKGLAREFDRVDDLDETTEKSANDMILEALKEVENVARGKRFRLSDDDVAIVSENRSKTPKTTRKTKSAPRRVQPSRSCLSKRKKATDNDDAEEGTSMAKRQKSVKREILEDMECSEKFLKEQKLEEVLELLKFQEWNNQLCPA